MTPKQYTSYHIAAFFEGLGDSLCTVIPDLQSTYHDPVTAASQPPGRSGITTVVEGAKEVFKEGLYVLEAGPEMVRTNAAWQAELDQSEGALGTEFMWTR